MKLKIVRDGKEKTIYATLEERRDEEQQAGKKTEAARSSEKIGIRVQNLTKELAREYKYEGEEGVIVTYVKHGSVAYREGIRTGDLIKAINRKKVRNVDDFNKIMNSIKGGDIVFMRLCKGTDHYYVSFRMPK